jgi:hypothetical protein
MEGNKKMFLHLQNPDDPSNTDRVSLYVLLAVEILTRRQSMAYVSLYVLLAVEILTRRQSMAYVSHLGEFEGANKLSDARGLYVAHLD